jgi:hypothetical protein
VVGEVLNTIQTCKSGSQLEESALEDPYLFKVLAFLMYRGYIFPKQALEQFLELFWDKVVDVAGERDRRVLSTEEVAEKLGAFYRQIGLDLRLNESALGDDIVSLYREQIFAWFEQLRREANVSALSSPKDIVLNDLLYAAYLLRGGSFDDLLKTWNAAVSEPEETSENSQQRARRFKKFMSEGVQSLTRAEVAALIKILCVDEDQETVGVIARLLQKCRLQSSAQGKTFATLVGPAKLGSP